MEVEFSGSKTLFWVWGIRSMVQKANRTNLVQCGKLAVVSLEVIVVVDVELDHGLGDDDGCRVPLVVVVSR